MSTETYRLTFCEQGELIQGKGLFYVIQYFTYNCYLGYHIRMHYDYVRYLGISNQVSLTWTLNTSFAIAFQNKVSIFSTQSFNKRGYFFGCGFLYIYFDENGQLQRWIEDWTQHDSSLLDHTLLLKCLVNAMRTIPREPQNVLFLP